MKSIDFVKSLEAKALEPTMLSLVGAIKDIARATSLDMTFMPQILDGADLAVNEYMAAVETCTMDLFDSFEREFNIFKGLVEKYRIGRECKYV